MEPDWGSTGDIYFGGDTAAKIFVGLTPGALFLETGTIGGTMDGMRSISMDFISVPGLGTTD